jgi:manganese-dependent inorganic pyrophosphatase
MQKRMDKDDLGMIILMLTDVLKEGTQLIYLGDGEIIQQAFGVTPRDNTLFLPGVMSRKKQVIPMLSALWG